MNFFELRLAWKYFRARRRSLARFTSFVAIIGIAAGVASLIIALALARGFADQLRDKILDNTSHILITSVDGGEIAKWRAVSEDLQGTKDIVRVLPAKFESAVIIGPDATAYAIIRVVIDEAESPPASAQREDAAIEISMGSELASKTGLSAGDEFGLITIADTGNSKVKLKETFKTGLYEYDSTWITISAQNYQWLAGRTPFVPTALNVSVRDIFASDSIAAVIRGKLGGGFRVMDWQEANRPLFEALSLERKVAMVIISLIILIASLNITTTLALLVNERRLDIAILRTCGAKTRNIVTIFLLEGLFLGIIGNLAGLILGLLVCLTGNYFRLINLPMEVYSLGYVPFQIEPVNFLLIVVIAFLLCLIASLYPSFKASRIKPLENLRRQ